MALLHQNPPSAFFTKLSFCSREFKWVNHVRSGDAQSWTRAHTCPYLNKRIELIGVHTRVISKKIGFFRRDFVLLFAFERLFQSSKNRASDHQVNHNHHENGQHRLPLHDCVRWLVTTVHTSYHRSPGRYGQPGYRIVPVGLWVTGLHSGLDSH